ncbi:Uu.00g084470.m01.CDS01 [Anthostomella pinea]|uniref:Uu.00g084470.m01.CDS01 n=1 Tax=Anthostomella pinea TaxID=933095 RepID=A0AAI8YJK8_9PEZI|nr:Uu.00g084470.m01.CDS01 [Anthostomella pinea]
MILPKTNLIALLGFGLLVQSMAFGPSHDRQVAKRGNTVVARGAEDDIFMKDAPIIDDVDEEET